MGRLPGLPLCSGYNRYLYGRDLLFQQESDATELRTCPHCGHENQETDRFCSNCGTRLTPTAPPSPEEPPAPIEDAAPPEPEAPPPAPPSEPASTIPPQFTPPPRNEWDLPDRDEPVDENWRMSSLGPPPQRPRRTWLWIIIAILALFVLACCIFFFWVSATDSGSQWFSDIATQVSEEATKQAQ